MSARIHVCGSCADRLVADGGELVPGPHVLALGTLCQAHAGEAPATSVVAAPDGWDAAADTLDAATLDGTPVAVGPLTDLATRFLCAWTSGKPEDPDAALVDTAIAWARLVARRTKGA